MDTLNYLAPGHMSQYFLFFIPGFIAMQVGALLVPVSDIDFSKRIPVAVGYSALNYAVMSIALWFIKLAGRPNLTTIATAAFMFIVPIIYPFIFKKVREKQWLGITTPYPTAWDEFFSKRRQYWVRVHFKDSSVLTGWYGQPDSAASQYPEPQQLYISEVWVQSNTGDMQKSTRTAGILVSMTEVSYLEFLT
uniref:Uncharacterized protein n=1 Tax=mine drainage metagenome TaxID=410659 RepID=E6QWP5_9ZZZZ